MLKVIKTADGSDTIFNSAIIENYHSSFGAVQESRHIFIEAGLNQIIKPVIWVLEIGFGTGLNALLTLDWAEKNLKQVHYFGVEAFPVSEEILSKLNYAGLLALDNNLFKKLHSRSRKNITLGSFFTSEVYYEPVQSVSLPDNQFDVVYFDAFSPEVQPEMWDKDIFSKIESSMKLGGLLTTYSCKGNVKRAMTSAGLSIEKLPGPPGKREFLRARKL